MFFEKKWGGTRFRGSRCGPDGSKMGEISMCVRVWSPRDNHRSFQNDFLCVKKVSYHILRWWKKVSHMVSHRESFLHPFQKSRLDFHRFFRYKLLIRCKWLTIWLTTCMPKGGEKFFFVKHTNDSPFDSLFDSPSARMCDFCETFPWTLSPWRPNDSPFDSPDL